MCEGIRSFLDESAAAGRSERTSQSLFVNGFANQSTVPIKEHLKRGAILSKLMGGGEDSEAEI